MQVFESPFDTVDDPEKERTAHEALMACRDRLVEGWDPRLIKSWSRMQDAEGKVVAVEEPVTPAGNPEAEISSPPRGLVGWLLDSA